MIAQPTTRFDPEQASAMNDRASRHAALAAAVAGLRVRRGRLAVEQVLLAAAAILFPLGLVFIILGWEGAAHNGHTYAQIDYLISGGIFGLGLSVAGGFMYFGYWLSRQLSESRRQNALTVQALQRLEDLVDFAVNSRVAGEAAFIGDAGAGHGAYARDRAGYLEDKRAAGDGSERRNGRRSASGRGSPSRSGAGSSTGPASGAAAEADRPTGQVPAVGGGALFATPRGNLLHRAECPVVARRNDLKTVEPGTEGYRYCTMCNAGVPV